MRPARPSACGPAHAPSDAPPRPTRRSRSIAALGALAAGLVVLLAPTLALAEEAVKDSTFGHSIDDFIGTYIVGPLATVFFMEVPVLEMPLVVAWLVFGAVFFTLRMAFVNFRMFSHAVALVRGKFDKPDHKGEVSHFQALASALSATVGLGNIAGVAIAVGTGGPGATFWMIAAGLLGMASKFTECTLGQHYRHVRSDGRIMGGAMYYLSEGLAEKGWPRLGMVLAVMFAFLCIGGSFGGGNAFQVKQSLTQIQVMIPALADAQWVYGLIMAVLVGVVIIGGIQRIAKVADKIVPLMCGLYVLACLYILGVEYEHIPRAFSAIFEGAFTADGIKGGVLGVLIIGFKRAAFSNEAGIGSAAIAHSAAKTEYPVQEGIVALLEPFIDTVVICTMTALVIVITEAYANPDYAVFIEKNQGAALTSHAMSHVITWFPYILSVAVFLFAYSTMISWSYYGERCWVWLFGDRSSMVYKLLFLLAAFGGSVVTATNVLDFSDLMVLGMAFPNILGLLFLSGNVKKWLDDYSQKLATGEVRAQR